MAKVYVYESDGDYRVFPPVVILHGGQKLHLINATEDDVKAKFPAGSVDEDDEVEQEVPKHGKAEVVARSQGDGKAQAYEYSIKIGLRRAKANSDPILIIEN